MYPLLKFGSIVVPSYVLFVAFGFLISSFLIDYFASFFTLTNKQAFNALCVTELGIILGAKLLYIIINIKRIITSETPFILLMKSGFVLYGGILGAILTILLFSLITKKSFYSVLSLVTLVAPLIQCFGRIGCFCAGCCYGKPYKGIFAVFITNEFRYPIQIISALFDFLIFITLLFLLKKEKQHYIVPIYFCLYGAGRFICEFFRGDISRGFIGILSISSWISIVLFFIGLILLLKKIKTIQISNT